MDQDRHRGSHVQHHIEEHMVRAGFLGFLTPSLGKDLQQRKVTIAGNRQEFRNTLN